MTDILVTDILLITLAIAALWCMGLAVVLVYLVWRGKR